MIVLRELAPELNLMAAVDTTLTISKCSSVWGTHKPFFVIGACGLHPGHARIPIKTLAEVVGTPLSTGCLLDVWQDHDVTVLIVVASSTSYVVIN